ncbi:uncharacterized protein LOC129905041 [Solanum dulcamara]|uniref:uncharacterized protein LOC129905041 n=1 Tax=Solanum dulcamara TaxID=45834 RepID=UPI0024852E02|nr:uncharacterized protein LOC129905041 [Solanum dulcamara]
MQGFSNTILDLELIDPLLQGAQFTWSRGEETLQATRIDRFLYSSEWTEMFTAIRQYTMPRVISDHKPILESGDWEASPSYFKFENMWLQAEGFIDMIKGWWQSYIIQGTPDFVLLQKLRNLKKDISKWNRELDQLAELRTLSAQEKAQSLNLKLQLQQIATAEEMSWRQKSRCLWLKEADKNTKFFQRMDNSHRRGNSIERLRIGDELTEDKGRIKDGILKYYQQIYKEAESWTPGPDGYTMAFFQKSWCFIKDDMLAALNFFHQNCQMVRSCNASFIALIPKKKARAESAFLKNRQITDASLIANKVLDWRMKSGESGILCKLDIEKAFDQLNWAYLVSILKQMGFGNRSLVGFFSTQKGLRQRDPLSPFLFLLAMEGLSQLLPKAKELQWVQGFQVGSNPATTVNVANLEELAGILSCKTGSLPTTYLGLPLGASFKSSGIWNGVIEKMEKRLATWKMQYLSMGGRLTLINSVLDSIPIPGSILKQMDRLRRRFLWEGNSLTHKYSLVKWQSVTQPKFQEGLGIRNLKLHNNSLLMKWLWRSGQIEAGFWRDITKAKYGIQDHWCPMKSTEPHGVGVWRHKQFPR